MIIESFKIFQDSSDSGSHDLARAETKRFELLKAFTPYLVSSEETWDAPSLIYAQ